MRKKYHSLRARAKKRNLPVTISFEYYAQLKRDDCHYCRVSNILLQFYCEVMGINTPWMTIDRKDNDVGYVPDNVVPSCFLCNKIKGSFFTEEEMCAIGVRFVAPKLKNFEDEAFDAFGEWCYTNFDGCDEDDEIELIDISLD